ncbi:YlbF family regulator [Paenibacillus crassostreae]|uniref:YlbF family regulator n=1 Tax=Paenibacillus crassostreae TaxID=1763538 RepID=A0A167EED6_9BACL|nr:YlbF family regulator [Paenibacillus crassostreae]AOZ91917.1 hypothetical protein LPB68_06580 [Paenibacillus crassostreae]OAB75452.1 hypothetical protein PNBC_08815 [Paenibacillus crassostreae]
MSIIKMDSNVVLEKMKELCTDLLQQEGYKEMRQMIDQFASDEQSTKQYEQFIEKHHMMQQKESQGLELTEAEFKDYEQEESDLYKNDVIRKFLYAQREFSQLHSLVSQYFTKTIELDRVPEAKELKKGGCGCGGNCGCGGGH